MRTSRFVLATSVLALVVPLATTASATGAEAATSKVVKLTVGLPPKTEMLTTDCNGTFDDGPQQVHVVGPGRPPLGKGSLELRGPGVQFVVFPINKAASSLTAEAVSLRGSVPGGIGYDVMLTLNATDSGADVLAETVPAGTAWHRYRLTTDPVEESHLDSAGTATDVGPTTYDAYTAAHPGSTVNDLEVDGSDCGGNGETYLDDLTTTVSGATTTYDLEPDPAIITDRAPATTAVRAQTTITGYVTRGGKPIQATGVELFAKPKGAETWTYAGTFDSTWNGVVYSEQFLTTDTTFRWMNPGTSDVGQITSRPFTVHINKPPKGKHH